MNNAYLSFMLLLLLFQPFPYYNYPMPGVNSVDDLSVPFGYRQQLQVTNENDNQLKQKHSGAYTKPQEYSKNKTPQDVQGRKESVLETSLTESGPQKESIPSGSGLEKKGSTQFERMNSPASLYEQQIANSISMGKPSFLPSSGPREQDVYNSYHKFNPGKYAENSPEWQMAMLHYLLDMKKHGHDVQEVSVDKVTLTRFD